MKSRPPVEHGFIQICGIIDRAEAEMLARCGVRYIGFPLRLPVHAEDCSETEAAAIIRALEAPVTGVLITYLNRAEEIVALCRQLAAPVVQLHGDVAIEELQRLRRFAADLTVIKSLVVGLHEADALEAALAKAAPWVDAFITDTFDPRTGATGATGRTHDWAVSRRLVEASPRPIILAGGLTPDNVAEAIDVVRPAGVDAHTGVEGADGRKDGDKVARFIAAARAAFDRLR